jgi:rhodanese-related sulfurtransferase
MYSRPSSLSNPLPTSGSSVVTRFCLHVAGASAAGGPALSSGMAKSAKELVEAANAVVPRITQAQAQEMIAGGNTLVVDVRDAPEVEASGKVAGAVHVSRGMLEFRADPESPYHDQNFAKDKTVILYCASGGRAALGGQALTELGYADVYNLGAFKDWAESGGAIDT